MIKDLVYNKAASIEKFINRVKEVYDNNYDNLQNYIKLDSIILNIQRASESSIDLAMHIVADEKLGIPQNSWDAFDILESNNILDKELANKMKAMVGFRNIALHDYESINIKVVQIIIEEHLYDFEEYMASLNKYMNR